MPELDQLLDALATDVGARTRAPGAPSVIKRARRRRMKAAVAVAVATAAVIAGSVVRVNGLDDDRTAPPIDQPDATKNPGLTTPLIAPESLLDVRELGFHVEPGPDIAVTDSWGITSDRQQTDVYVGRDARWAVVSVYYRGRSPRPMNGTSEDVTVNGLPGTYTEDVQSGGWEARLLWQYAPDSWAEVGISADGTPPSDLRQQYVMVAEAVRPGGETLRSPVRFDSTPASLPALSRAHRVGVSGPPSEWSVSVAVDDVTISATNAVDLGECVGDSGEPQTAAFTYRGFRGCVVPNGDQERVVLHLDGVDVTYDSDPSRGRPLEDIKRLLNGITVTPPPFLVENWFDLRTALMG